MLCTINRPIQAHVTFNPDARRPDLESFDWAHRHYVVDRINQVHRERQGESVVLCYSVSCGPDHFSLRFDTRECRWILESIFDPDGS